MSGFESNADSQIGPNARVSVVVIGRNEGQRLGRCFASLAQLPPENAPAEILYVDSGSTDDSLSVAREHCTTVIALSPERPTAALGRNAGWHATNGELVLFLDGDTELAPHFLARAAVAFADPAMAIVWGHRREKHPEDSTYNRVLDLDWIYPAGPAEFCGGDALFRRSFLTLTGGFDETLIAGEEPELCRRVLARGGRILHIDEPMTAHDLHITRFTQYWQRAKRAGYAYAEVSSRFAATPGRFWSMEAARHRKHAAAIPCFGVVLFVAIGLRSLAPIGVLLLVAVAVIVRTAWKARWKSSKWFTLVLYALHSHFQQIPIALGQRQFHVNRSRGVKQELLEYKRP